MNRNHLLTFIPLLAGLLLSQNGSADYQRGYVSMMGSSTVVPFVTAVGDRVTRSSHLHAPLIQSSGTGGGIKLFCGGINAEAPDIALASRAIKPKEREECDRNGVGPVLELKIGYDALILAQSRKAEPWSLTHTEARIAFAKWVAKPDGTMVLNPNHTWKDVRATLPAAPIELLGPPNTSATHDAFIDLISEVDCKSFPFVPKGAKEPSADDLHKCRSLRQDGVYREGRENDESHVDIIAASNGNQIGVFGYKIVTENQNRIRPIPIDGVEPTYENISTDAYMGSRPLYIYVKTRSIGVIPGLREFLAEMSNENAWGERGYLRSLGLITMPGSERGTYTAKLREVGVTPSTSTLGGGGTGKAGGKKGKKH